MKVSVLQEQTNSRFKVEGTWHYIPFPLPLWCRMVMALCIIKLHIVS